MQKGRRVSKSNKHLSPEEIRKKALKATSRRWGVRSNDFRIAQEIESYLLRRGDKSFYSYGEKDDCIFIGLSLLFQGDMSPATIDRFRRIIELGIERGLFRLDPDNSRHPTCWGLSIPARTEQQIAFGHLALVAG